MGAVKEFGAELASNERVSGHPLHPSKLKVMSPLSE